MTIALIAIFGVVNTILLLIVIKFVRSFLEPATTVLVRNPSIIKKTSVVVKHAIDKNTVIDDYETGDEIYDEYTSAPNGLDVASAHISINKLLRGSK
jgi:hypothetical protein